MNKNLVPVEFRPNHFHLPEADHRTDLSMLEKEIKFGWMPPDMRGPESRFHHGQTGASAGSGFRSVTVRLTR
jgi:hypothetical protein